MTQESIIRILAGANKVARQSKEVIKTSSTNYIEQNIMKGNYVTREEYEQLQKLVLKLKQEIIELKTQ
ncbi:MAG: hypothetical protein NWS20_03130 [Rickettsiaceae bacterium]|nr:hypothetical protein [Rickettsiaceae bacterium]MDP5021153.1 hypothetical protein [Rickettsiaceae bacterium]MDP5083402.1 hypothetical protein [Rickettsiaceae bacterium]